MKALLRSGGLVGSPFSYPAEAPRPHHGRGEAADRRFPADDMGSVVSGITSGSAELTAGVARPTRLARLARPRRVTAKAVTDGIGKTAIDWVIHRSRLF